MTGYKTHVFICTNQPDNPAKCGGKGAEEFRRNVKEDCKDLGKEVRVNASGCLGYCEQGIACVIYSEGQKPAWHLNLDSGSRFFLVSQVRNQKEPGT